MILMKLQNFTFGKLYFNIVGSDNSLHPIEIPAKILNCNVFYIQLNQLTLALFISSYIIHRLVTEP